MRDDSLDEETRERLVAGARWDVRAEVDKVRGLAGKGTQIHTYMYTTLASFSVNAYHNPDCKHAVSVS